MIGRILIVIIHFVLSIQKKDVEELASGILDNLYILGVDEIEDEKVRAAGQAFFVYDDCVYNRVYKSGNADICQNV